MICLYDMTQSSLHRKRTFGHVTEFCFRFRRNLDYQEVLAKLAEQGISIRVASPKLVMEEVLTGYLYSWDPEPSGLRVVLSFDA